MKPHISMLASKYHLTLITNGMNANLSILLNDNVCFIDVGIERNISLWKDFIALLQLYRIFHKEHFDAVHSIMPKSGLLAMLAAFFARVPLRIHTFTGQVWANKTGFSRLVLRGLDKLLANCATSLLADSASQRKFLIQECVVDESKISVLGNGSICGVDTKRFKPDSGVRHRLRSELDIPHDAIVYLFLGRLNKDKGIQDLANAFAGMAEEEPNAHLLVVGPDEGGMDKQLELILHKCQDRYHRVGFKPNPECYMACADIFCLPSYREGFGTVVIEAAAVGLPSLASNIYGLVDAVKSGQTGILHRSGNVKDIKYGLLLLTHNNKMRKKMSDQAIVYATDYFSNDIVVKAMLDYYDSKLYLM
jgi:glycosyltransferase involved in cell wall biosynthesis